MPMTPIPPFPALSDRANGTYNGKAFDWASHMANTFVAEANALVASLNSIAAGGAYAIPFMYGSAGTAGRLSITTGGAQDATTALALNNVSSAGKNVAAQLLAFGASSSSARGQLRIVKVGDPSAYLIFSVTGPVSSVEGYQVVPVSKIDSSAASPFAGGDGLLVFFQRTGDKGDPGQVGKFPILWVRDEKPSGTAGSTGGHVVGSSNVRTLNTTMRNEISGASLASNRITLPAGTYRFRGSVPASGVGAHRALIYNITAGNVTVYGTNESDPGASSNSLFNGDVTFSVATTLEIRHYLSSTAGNLGSPSSISGVSETYTEMTFEKVA